MLNPQISSPSASLDKNKPFENRVTQTFTWMKETFKQKLEEQANLGMEVVGFQDEFCRQSLNLRNILTEKFTQDFHFTLIAAINGIKKENIRKDTFHLVLLKKYLDVNFLEYNEKLNIIGAREPNAFCSIPQFDEEDNFVHLCFLQPFRLFAIKPDMRKKIRENHENSEREWLLFENTDSDLAPMFRAYIQLCLVSMILEDYATEDNQYYCETIDNNLDNLMKIEEELKAQIKKDLQSIFLSASKNDALPESNQKIRGDRSGLIHNIPILLLLESLSIPEFSNIADDYSIGRLIYGQPREALHEALASNQVKKERSSFKKKVKFAFYWFFAHLNLSTSLFWSKRVLKILSAQYRSFKIYVTNTEADFFSFAIKSLFTIPAFFILVASPLLIIFPWVYGLTSLPFSLLRAFCVHGPFDSLRHYQCLKLIDIIEFLKDIGLFFWYIVPVFNSMLGMMIDLIPVSLISIGMIASHLFLSAIYFLTVSGTDHSSTHIFTLVDSYFFRFFSSSLVIGIGAYLTMGIVGRQIYPWLPPLPEGAHRASAFFQRLFITQPNRKDYEREVSHIVLKPQEVERIPMKKDIVMPTQEEVNEREALIKDLSQIALYNLTSEQRKMIQSCRTKMAESSSIEEVRAEMKRARSVMQATVKKEDLNEIMNIIQKMSQEERQALKKDMQAMQETKGIAKRSFLPSLSLVQKLQAGGYESVNPEVLIPSPRPSSPLSSSHSPR